MRDGSFGRPAFQKQPPIFYAGDELHRIKRQRLQDALAASGLDAFLFFKAEAVRYVTDFYVKGYRPFAEPEYVVLVTRTHAPVVGYISGSDDLRIRFKSDIQDARKLPSLAGWATAIGGMINDYRLGRAQIGTDIMPFPVHDGLKREFPHITFSDANAIWSNLTAIKHPAEIELIREAVRVADLGLRAAMAAVRPGVSEHAIAAEAVYVMRKHGSEFEPFIPLVAAGYNASMFERVATEKVVRKGELVILDIGAVVKGYTGDVGCTVACGEPSSEQKAVYRATRLALQEAKKMVRPGVTCRAIDARAREVIVAEGWGDYLYSGATGHQLGYGLHSDPLIDKHVDFEIVENMVMCLEPRIVLPDCPDIGGAHLEDVVAVTRTGFEQINTPPDTSSFFD